IPPHEIRFIQEAKNDKMRKQIIADMTEGKIRVLFGSTDMLGTVQDTCILTLFVFSLKSVLLFCNSTN
ncbi:hypothetical protein, partial [Capnocytophaga canis]|uniref:hypothetical protein n=1 Tax=Capnocytophaga canis TaxID=1848903 RepID=UPI0037D3E672